jgi:sugar phosphate isomerase/epimerase
MTKPLIGLSMLYCLSEPFSKMTMQLAKTGTAYIEIVDDGLHTLNTQRVKLLNEMAKSHSLKYSVHAPFADINIASPSKPILNAIIKRLEKSMANASALNAYLWIFHPGLKTGISMFYPEQDWFQNLETISHLSKIAEDYGVKIAIENVPEPYPFLMKSVEHFRKFYEESDTDISMVLDIGHANINGQTELFLKIFKDKIVHIHAHDNDGKDDQHLGIGYGTVDWEKIAKLLTHMQYDRALIIESIEHIEESIQKLNRLFS